jgi:tetratricopeptide (TPR) repeat protein
MRGTILFFISLCFILNLRAQDSLITTPPKELTDAYELAVENEDIEEQIRNLTFIADHIARAGNYDLAEQYYNKAIKFSFKHDIHTYTGNNRIGLAELYRVRGDYEKSLELCYQAIEDYTIIDYRHGVGSAYYNIAIVFDAIGNYSKAIEYCDSSIAIARLNENKYFLMESYELKGLSYSKLNETEKALQLLETSLQYFLKIENAYKIFSAYINIGFIYGEAEQNQKALENYYQAEKYCPPNDLRAKSTILGNIASQLIIAEQYDSALVYVDRSLLLAEQIGSKFLIQNRYEDKINIYRATKNHEEALHYTDKFIELKDEILNAENIATIEEMESKYKNQEKEKDLVLKQQKIQLLEKKRQVLEKNAQVANLKIYALIGCSVFLLLLAFLIYRNQKRKRKHEVIIFQKEQQLEATKKELIQSELEKTALNNQQLTSEIDYKNKELQNLAQHIVQKNDLLEKLKEEIKAGSSSSSNQLVQLINVGIDTDKEEFEQQVDHINSLFYKNLKDKFPELSSNDLRLLSLIKINMSSKEISILLNINPKSVDMARYRLRKKLNLSQDINLFDFLNQF